MNHNQSWSDKSEKDLIEPKPLAEWDNQELKIIGGCLQRIAKAQEKIADYPALLKENKRLRELTEKIFFERNELLFLINKCQNIIAHKEYAPIERIEDLHKAIIESELVKILNVTK